MLILMRFMAALIDLGKFDVLKEQEARFDVTVGGSVLMTLQD